MFQVQTMFESLHLPENTRSIYDVSLKATTHDEGQHIFLTLCLHRPADLLNSTSTSKASTIWLSFFTGYNFVSLANEKDDKTFWYVSNEDDYDVVLHVNKVPL